MARPISWLPRLHELRRSVADSVRSHYSSSDIERLFQLQPRQAQKIAALFPTVPVGNAQLVPRENLAQFLDRLAIADDPAEEFSKIRLEPKPQVLRKKLRLLVRRDELADIDLPPEGVRLEFGLFTAKFSNTDQLIEAGRWLALILRDHWDKVEERFVQRVDVEPEDEEARLEREDLEYFRKFLKEHP
jgi:hypothetical protein